MKKTKDQLKFSKSERNGAILLSFLILIVAALPYLWPLIFKQKNNFDISEFKAQINDFIENQKIIEEEKQNKYTDFYKKENYPKKSFDFKDISKSAVENKITPFYFNPNNLPEEKWEEMGFTSKQIDMIKNYEKKGGKFYKKEDLKKMYCIDEKTYEILDPFIIIPKDTIKQTSKKEYEQIDYSNLIVDLNLADTSELRKLKGIGSSFSQRIIKYRNSLGGFVKKEQLLEVWGLSNDLFKSIEDNISISNPKIKKININSATIDDLKLHPYIDFYVARSIVKYREAHGKYKKVSEITNSDLVHKDLLLKLEPYLTTE